MTFKPLSLSWQAFRFIVALLLVVIVHAAAIAIAMALNVGKYSNRQPSEERKEAAEASPSGCKDSPGGK
jgi:flagellar basal body-associated protein FliL